jgi:uncharacterized membrane protein
LSALRLSSSLNGAASLIGPTDTWGNIAALTGTATVSQVIGKKTRIGRLLGPPVTAMALTFLLASIGVLHPGGTAAAKSLQLLSLQMATPLILLGADLRDCLSRCGPLLASFLTAAVSTVAACLVGWFTSRSMLQAALGNDGLIIASALMAKNIGGGINYIAVCRCLSASPQAVAAGLCIDNLFALLYFPVTNALASGLPDVGGVDATITTTTTTKALHETTKDAKQEQPISDGSSSAITIQEVCSVVFLASALLWIGESIGGVAGALPCCTIVTVLFASWAPRQWILPLQPAAEVLGTTCLYWFFTTAGAPGIAVAESVRLSLVPLTIFLSSLYGIHGLILWILNRFWGETVACFASQRLLVSSSAAIGGPATSAALCQANEWKSLLVPSLLVGNIGYAIATFCGLAYHSLLQ